MPFAHPENYPNLTIRVSRLCRAFNALTREQQQDVISEDVYAINLTTFRSHAPQPRAFFAR